MSILTTDGVPISLDASDLRYTHNGVTFGLKLRTVQIAGQTGLYVCELAGQNWIIAMNLDEDVTEQKIDAAGGVLAYIKSLLPRLNKWLVKRFPADSSAPQGLVQQLDAALPQTVTFVVVGGHLTARVRE